MPGEDFVVPNHMRPVDGDRVASADVRHKRSAGLHLRGRPRLAIVIPFMLDADAIGIRIDPRPQVLRIVMPDARLDLPGFADRIMSAHMRLWIREP